LLLDGDDDSLDYGEFDEEDEVEALWELAEKSTSNASPRPPPTRLCVSMRSLVRFVCNCRRPH
jgi:hypothetical protein